jgi:hypothetical protein
MYIASYGLAPFFKSLLQNKLQEEPYVFMFDESLNKEQQKNQMDMVVRFWNHDSVQSRFYNSMFMGHATAGDMVATTGLVLVLSNVFYMFTILICM